MTSAKELTDFFTISERLECELRLTRMSNGECQTVASHSWNMIMMAITLKPYLKNRVNMEIVMELCALHDLPESIAHDIPLHQQTAEIKQKKHIQENAAINTINTLLDNADIAARSERVVTVNQKIEKRFSDGRFGIITDIYSQ